MRTHTSTGEKGERGAALVETALLLPLLILLVFGVIEASWAFSQQNDVRYGSREGARLAAQNFGDVQDVAEEVCARMDTIYASQTPTVTLTAVSGSGNVDSLAEITVEANVQTLTGLLDGFFSVRLGSTLQFRVEDPVTSDAAEWWADPSGQSFTCT
jgi:Flp pilus assembly protein TadG